MNRTTVQVMMKAGQIEKTNDRDYEVEERCAITLPRTTTFLTELWGEGEVEKSRERGGRGGEGGEKERAIVDG